MCTKSSRELHPGNNSYMSPTSENICEFIMNEDQNLEDCDTLVDSLTGLFSKMEIDSHAEQTEKPASSKPMPMAVEEQ